jgi:predicted transcriptional regulator
MPKLTDRQHKKIIARYAETQNYSLVAKEFGVSETTIRRHCKADKATSEKVARKKEQNTLDMLAFMDSRKGKAQDLVDRILITLNDPEKLQTASVRDLATALGIIVDKFTQATPQENAKANTLLEEIKQGIEEGKKYVE